MQDSRILKASIYADDVGSEPSRDFLWGESWLEKWNEHVVVKNYHTGGWEHIWEVLGPAQAINEIPRHLLCGSTWAGVTGKKAD